MTDNLIPVHGPTNPPADAAGPVRRMCQIIGLKPEKEAYYRELHADVWPGVLERLARSNIHNYSIFITEIAGKKYLVAYFEYGGTDLAADMQAIAADPETQRWWLETDPCQFPLPSAAPGEKWTGLECVFFMP
jgi:L-rhamnose mutarotase